MPPDTSRIALTRSDAASAVRDGAVTAADALLDVLTPVFDAAFAPFAHLVLAVSGGSDSTALMHLCSAWRRRRLDRSDAAAPPAFSILTIDHALRPGSDCEAEAVARAAGLLGMLPHTTLRWKGRKPATGVQAAARTARRGFIAAHLTANGWPAVVMAHTADDQAETLLMRLARGSGIDGLAAMRAAVTIGCGQTLLRPLLGIPKADLTRYLRERGLPWCEDPSNANETYERVRWRAWRTYAATAGLDFDSTALARSAQRAARAAKALDAVADRTWQNRGARADFDRLGVASLEWGWLLEQPEEIRLRLLAGLIAAIGGQAGAVSLGDLEALTARRGWRDPPAGTLHGVQFRALPPKAGAPARLLLLREWGRAGQPEVTLAQGETLDWDRRFRVTLAPTAPTPLRLGPLGDAALTARAELQSHRIVGGPRALVTQPALFDDAELICAPTLGFTRSGYGELIRCETLQPRFGQSMRDSFIPD